MKIEAGKTYIDGEGTIVGPMECRSGPYYQFGCQTSVGYRLYTQDGFYNECTRCPEDLVAECKEETTMKPGDYYFDENNNMRSVHEDENGEEALIEGCHAERVEEREIVGWIEEDHGRKYPVYADERSEAMYADERSEAMYADERSEAMYADEDDAGADSLPLLNIFKPIRTIHAKTPAKFLARADDGSYLFEVGGRYTVWRVDADDVDDQFENVPEDALRAVVRLYKNAEGNKFFVWGSDARSQSALATCELTYSDEEGWRVRDLKGETK